MRQRLRREWLQQYGGAVAHSQLALPAAQLASVVLPPVLLAYLPQQRQALLAGAPLPLALLADTAALRGCFALLLRSLAATDLQHNLLGLAATESAKEGQQQQPEQQLLGQLQRLLLLCGSMLGGSGVDPLLQAAAGRLVGILCDRSLWKCFPPPTQQQQQWDAVPPQERLQQQLHAWLVPLPLLGAPAQRLVACLSPGDASEASSGSQQQQAQLAAVLNSVVVAQLKLWRQLMQTPAGSSNAPTASPDSQPAAAQQLLQLLATPGLLPLLSPATVAQLTAAPGFAALLGAAATWVPSGGSSGGSSSGGTSSGGSSTLWLLGALAQLAAGKKTIQQQEGQQQRQLDFLLPSALLQQPGVAAALGAAALALLPPALEASSASRGTGSVDLLDSQLWPFAEGTFAAQLLELLPLEQFAQVYHLLLLLAASLGKGKQAQSARLLSALAFGTRLLPMLWRHLATSIGLPLEAPLQVSPLAALPCCRCILRCTNRPCIENTDTLTMHTAHLPAARPISLPAGHAGLGGSHSLPRHRRPGPASCHPAGPLLPVSGRRHLSCRHVPACAGCCSIATRRTAADRAAVPRCSAIYCRVLQGVLPRLASR